MSRPNSKYPNDPDQTRWLTLTRQGQSGAFSPIVEKYQQPLYHFCYRLLKNTDEAEDATQETFLRAYAKLDAYDDTRSFSTWLFSIASHYCLDLLRKRRSEFVSWDEMVSWPPLSSHDPAPERAVIKAEATQAVQSLLKMLPPEHRVAVILKYWHAMSCEEIAQTLNTTVSAIKSRLFRARKMMAAQGATPRTQPI